MYRCFSSRMERNLTYFASDVHLGFPVGDPVEREQRFVLWLKEIPRDRTRALYLLGDIWDFWFEYRDVIPREGIRVVAQLIDLIDNGVEVYFFEGNHDVWTFSFFESLGMRKLRQPCFVDINGMTFCLGHGDGVGGAKPGYRLMMGLFRNKLAQKLFGSLHPRMAFSVAEFWSRSSRAAHGKYSFVAEREPLYAFAESVLSERKVDCFVFGHFHSPVDIRMPGGARFVILRDWMGGGTPCAVLNGPSFELDC